MIDIRKAAAQQNTLKGGKVTDWSVSLDGEELYKLPERFTVQETFEIRDIVEKMMNYAFEQGKEEANSLAGVKIQRILDNGNTQLGALKDENIRLAEALEKHIIENEGL